ncbi:MAG TPA: alpha/beta hydrolase [Nitrososphaeraceae archaeon]|nr:alpha/beta hydrolase [Nitrososphaeraceae archaeon]
MVIAITFGISILSFLNNTNPLVYAVDNYNYSTVENNTRLLLESLQKNPGPQLYTLTPSEARNILSGLQQSGQIEKLPAKIENKTIPVGPSGEIFIQIVKPQGTSNETLPVVMYFHGGGWVLGGFDTHERLLRELANGAHTAIVFVNYTRSPEAKYPIPLVEAYAATKWISENGQTLNLDPSRLAVAGDSVGGNMATAVALLAKERGVPTITFQLLFYPVTDANFDTPSYLAYQDGYFLTREAMKWFWDNYLSNDTNRKEPTVSPLQASDEQLGGLPPTLIIVGENDVLRDEGEAYAHKLMQAGVTTTATRYLGTIHDFVMLNAITDTPAARGAIDQASHTLKEVLSE